MPFFLFSVLLIGGVSFLAGFLGPIALNPDANQGPLLGILITGPLGVIAGVLLGLILPLLIKGPTKVGVIWGLAAILAVAIPIGCLPGSKSVGTIYRGTITAEESATSLTATAIADWTERAKQHPHYQPRANWAGEMTEAVQSAAGRVVTLTTTEAWDVRELRKPWNRGTYELIPQPAERTLRVYVAAGTELAPIGEYWVTSARPAREWPPQNIPMFLGVAEAAPPLPQMLGP